MTIRNIYEGYQTSPKGADGFEVQDDAQVGVVEGNGFKTQQLPWDEWAAQVTDIHGAPIDQSSRMAWSKGESPDEHAQDLLHSSQKEKGEHPWMTDDQAMQVAKDHEAEGQGYDPFKDADDLDAAAVDSGFEDWVKGHNASLGKASGSLGEETEELPGYDAWKTTPPEGDAQFEDWLQDVLESLPENIDQKGVDHAVAVGEPQDAYESGMSTEDYVARLIDRYGLSESVTVAGFFRPE